MEHKIIRAALLNSTDQTVIFCIDQARENSTMDHVYLNDKMRPKWISMMNIY